MSSVTDLSVVRDAPVAGVVEMLKEWLRLAEAGEVRSIAVAGVMRDESVEAAHYIGGGKVSDVVYAVGSLERSVWASCPTEVEVTHE